jgi:hypothetical protein
MEAEVNRLDLRPLLLAEVNRLDLPPLFLKASTTIVAAFT